MEKGNLLPILTIILLVLPLGSAIFIGEAQSEPTYGTLTISEEPETPEEPGEETEDNNRHSQIQAQRQADENIESELREIKYSEWQCINNRLQRTHTTLNHIEYEYGQSCGFELPPSEKTDISTIAWIMLNMILVLLILITIVSILILRKK